jgi:hypothetical protein
MREPEARTVYSAQPMLTQLQGDLYYFAFFTITQSLLLTALVIKPSPYWWIFFLLTAGLNFYSRGHQDWKKRPGVNFFVKGILRWTNYIIRHMSKYSNMTSSVLVFPSMSPCPDAFMALAQVLHTKGDTRHIRWVEEHPQDNTIYLPTESHGQLVCILAPTFWQGNIDGNAGSSRIAQNDQAVPQ